MPNYSRRSFLQKSGSVGIGGVASQWALGEGDEPQWLNPGDDNFSTSCVPFNTEIRTKPGLIARCGTPASVASAIRYAGENNLPVAVRSGGHSFVGHSLNADGVVLDLSGMNQQMLSSTGEIYTAEPGVKLKNAYDFLLPQGRLLPAGSCGGVGLGGLTLGGGYGLFARQYGLTCDHLEGLSVVNGKGEIVDSRDDPELLWACRGGGNGNFGVAVSMRFRTQVAPAGLGAVRYTASPSNDVEMQNLMKEWFTIAAELPDPIFSAFVMNHRQVSVLLTSPHSPGGPAFSRASESFRSLGMRTKGASHLALAKALPRYYGRPNPLPFRNFSGGYYRGYHDIGPAAEEIIHEIRSTPGSIFQVNTLGGAITRGPDSAYPHREFPFLGEVQTYWKPGEFGQREALLESSERVRLAIAGAGVTRHYRNYPTLKFENWRSDYYGEGYGRLQQIKARIDPDNVIRHRQSVTV